MGGGVIDISSFACGEPDIRHHPLPHNAGSKRGDPAFPKLYPNHPTNPSWPGFASGLLKTLPRDNALSLG
ncbi:MAG: hypothetical protein ACOWYE_11585 [Desulfatiglandales bacterium]